MSSTITLPALAESSIRDPDTIFAGIKRLFLKVTSNRFQIFPKNVKFALIAAKKQHEETFCVDKDLRSGGRTLVPCKPGGVWPPR